MTVSGESLDPKSRVQVLDDNGYVLENAEIPALADAELVEMYHEMKFGRHFDERAISLQRQGRLGTYTPLAGQEGAQVGSVHALDDEDWLIPSFREHLAKMVFGQPPEDVLLYWGGYEQGNEIPEQLHLFTEAIPVGSQIPHATGLAWASKLRHEADRAFLCYFGDGATSEGAFHEGLNFAGVFDVPAVFFCNNNQWAISVPRERQTAAPTYAQKASAYGFEGVQVDGMDPLAVYKVTKDAVEKAKNPDGDDLRPTLIEAVQYRFGAHTTADDPSVYRDEEEVERWKQKDPIPRLERFLRDRDVLDDERIATIERSVEVEVADAIDGAASVEANPDEMFEHVYEEKTAGLKSQREYLAALRNRYGDDELLQE